MSHPHSQRSSRNGPWLAGVFCEEEGLLPLCLISVQVPALTTHKVCFVRHFYCGPRGQSFLESFKAKSSSKQQQEQQRNPSVSFGTKAVLPQLTLTMCRGMFCVSLRPIRSPQLSLDVLREWLWLLQPTGETLQSKGSYCGQGQAFQRESRNEARGERTTVLPLRRWHSQWAGHLSWMVTRWLEYRGHKRELLVLA